MQPSEEKRGQVGVTISVGVGDAGKRWRRGGGGVSQV